MKLLLSNIESLSCEAHGPFFVELRQVARFYHDVGLCSLGAHFSAVEQTDKPNGHLYVNEMQKRNGVHLHL